MPSSHLILYHPLFLLPQILPSIRVFSNESTLHMRCPKYWSFSFRIIPSKEILVGSPCSPRDSQESSPTPQFKSISSSALTKYGTLLFFTITGLLLIQRAWSYLRESPSGNVTRFFRKSWIIPHRAFAQICFGVNQSTGVCFAVRSYQSSSSYIPIFFFPISKVEYLKFLPWKNIISARKYLQRCGWVCTIVSVHG